MDGCVEDLFLIQSENKIEGVFIWEIEVLQERRKFEIALLIAKVPSVLAKKWRYSY